MFAFITKQRNGHQPYASLLHLAALAFIYSLFIVVYPQRSRLSILSNNPGVYLGFLVSFAVAMLLLCYVNWVTIKLDQRFSWATSPILRILFQFVCGVCVTAIVDKYLIWGYYTLLHHSFKSGKFLNREFLLIQLSLLFLNFLYFCWYWASNRQILFKNKLASIIKPVFPKIKVYDGYRSFQVGIDEVVAIKREQYKGDVLLLNNKSYEIKDRTKELKSLMDEYHFFEIYRGIWFSLKFVTGWEKVGERRYVLHLKEGINSSISTAISKDCFAHFKQALEDYNSVKGDIADF